MAISSPPPAPQRGDRATFSQRVDAFLLWLVGLPAQLNSFLSSLTTLAAGGANSFSYTFDSVTTDADPGTGKLRLGSATQNGAVVMRIDTTAGNGGDITAFLASFAAGTSNVKGSVRLQKVNDVTAYLLFDVTAVATPTGYRNLTLVPRTSSAASPFANNDTLMVFFDKNGDKGDGGNTPTAQQMRDAIGTLPIENGGTGATTMLAARQALDVPATGEALLLAKSNAAAGTKIVGNTPGIGDIHGANATARVPLTISNGGVAGTSAVLYFRREGTLGGLIGIDFDDQWRLTTPSGTAAYLLWHAGNFNPANYAPLSGAAFTGPISAPSITNTSDERLKTNWRSLTDAQIDALAALDLVGVFDWKDGSGSDVGASAQQIRAIVPEAVREAADGTLSVSYAGLVFAMTHAALRRSRAAA